MFPRSHSVRFAETPLLRRGLAFNIQVMTPERHFLRATEFFRNAASVLAGLWIVGGLFLYFIAR